MSLTKSGIWYPDGNFTANPRVIAAQQAANLESVISSERLHHGSIEYASEAARDLANPNPQQGDQCTVAGAPMTYFTTGGWIPIKTTKAPLTSGGARIPLTWNAVSTTLTTVYSGTIPAVPYPAVVNFNLNFVGSLTGTGYANVNLLWNGSGILSVRQIVTNHTVSGSIWYNLPVNTSAAITVTVVSSVSTTASTVSSNTIYNFMQWQVLPA